MKKSDLAAVSLSVMSLPTMVASVAGVVAVLSAQPAAATVTCTAGTVSTALTCALATGGYIAQAAGFTGSVNVGIDVEEDATGFGACGVHYQGTGNRYGLTTQGGSLETVTGTLLASGVLPTANITGGGC